MGRGRAHNLFRRLFRGHFNRDASLWRMRLAGVQYGDGAIWPDVAVEEGNLTQQIFLLSKALGETRCSRVPSSRFRGTGTGSRYA